MQKKHLEICVDSIASCLEAQKGGANRVELCANLVEGGITPDYATIVYAKEKLKIDIMVMIRPRGGDFLYSDLEFSLMKENIQLCKRVGVKGVVLGLLLSEGNVDVERVAQLVKIARPLEVCFHRAVDMTNDYDKAFEDIITCGCNRVLTSGQKNTALEGIKNIANAQKKYGNQIEIMAASGVNAQNVEEIYLQSKINNFHFSAKKLIKSNMIFRQNNVSMGNKYMDEYSIVTADASKVKQVRKILDKLEK